MKQPAIQYRLWNSIPRGECMQRLSQPQSNSPSSLPPKRPSRFGNIILRISRSIAFAAGICLAVSAESAPLLAIEEPVGSPIVSGTASVDFGQVGIGGYREKVFAIRNSGTSDLFVDSITGVGGDSAVFAINPFFTSATPIPPGAQNYFQIRFSPVTEGTFTTTLRIVSNDTAQSPFDITLTVQAAGLPSPQPTFRYRRPGDDQFTVIANGATINFGATKFGEPADLEFEIENAAAADADFIVASHLNYSQENGIIRNTTGSRFYGFGMPDSSSNRVRPGTTFGFWLSFEPTARGLTVANHDFINFESSPSFVLTGTGIAGDVTVEFPDGQEYLSGLGFADFGSVANGGSLAKRFILRNAGDGDLENLSFIVRNNGSGNSTSVLTVESPYNPKVPLAPGSDSPFSLVLTPESDFASYNMQVEIYSNDPDDNPFVILVSGSATTATQILDLEISSSGLTGDAALPDAIPFNDGVPNLLKYAFNMNLSGADSGTLTPGTGTSGLPTFELDETGPTPVVRVQYIRRQGSGLVYTPLKSGNLQTGSFEPLNGTETSEPIGDFERVTVVAPCNPAVEPSCFWQVMVSIP